MSNLIKDDKVYILQLSNKADASLATWLLIDNDLIHLLQLLCHVTLLRHDFFKQTLHICQRMCLCVVIFLIF